MSRLCLLAAFATLLCSAGPSLSAPAPRPRTASSVTLPAGPGDVAQVPVTITLPRQTPYQQGSAEEARYLKGFAEGYADAVRMRFS